MRVKSAVKSVNYTLREGDVEGIQSVVAQPYRYQWAVEFSDSVYPDGLELPYGVPLVFQGHSTTTKPST
jgi:hypothetical protein